jgi:hypothetical protein
VTSVRLLEFLDGVLHLYYGSAFGVPPRMRRAEVERLLTDDAQRRLEQAELAAVEWGRSEIAGEVTIASERALVTSEGLLYAAALRSSRGRSVRSRHATFDQPLDAAGRPAADVRRSLLYYLAAPCASFDPFVDRMRATPLRKNSAAAVDSRFGHDLDFPWPHDAGLRRTLGSHHVLVWIQRSTKGA